MSTTRCHLSVLGLGIALGVTWSLSAFFLGLAAWLLGWGTDIVNALSSFYIGYTPTLIGSFIGMLWGFADSFIGGVVIAWIYNRVVGRCNAEQTEKAN
jgi:hypothetical protein